MYLIYFLFAIVCRFTVTWKAILDIYNHLFSLVKTNLVYLLVFTQEQKLGWGSIVNIGACFIWQHFIGIWPRDVYEFPSSFWLQPTGISYVVKWFVKFPISSPAPKTSGLSKESLSFYCQLSFGWLKHKRGVMKKMLITFSLSGHPIKINNASFPW